MKYLIFKFISVLSLIFVLSACYNDTNENPENKNKGKIKEEVNLTYKNIKSLTVHYQGKVNAFPATVSLFIKDEGKMIRSDFKSFNGKDTDLVSFFKINQDYFFIDNKKGLKVKKRIAKSDFLNFFYFPVDKYLKTDKSKNIERFENRNVVNKNCQHLQIKTDTSQADFFVWNNILLKVNTKMRTGKNLTKVVLQAKTLEENMPFPDSLFKIDLK